MPIYLVVRSSFCFHAEQSVSTPALLPKVSCVFVDTLLRYQELWRRVKKQLISVGKGGVKASHIRSLHSLVAAHTLVKVKVRYGGGRLV